MLSDKVRERRFLPLKVTVISSANNINFRLLEISDKSFMYIRNKIRPMILPCGTLKDISLNEELLLFRRKNCGVFVK